MYSSMASYVTFPEFSFIIFTALQESTGRTNFIHPFYYKWTCGFPIFCVHQQYCYEYCTIALVQMYRFLSGRASQCVCHTQLE